MAVVQLPSGEWVNVADGTSPDRIRQIMAENPAKPGQQPYGQPAPPPSAAPANAAPVLKPGQQDQSGIRGALNNIVHGATFGFDDELAGAAGAVKHGVLNSITGKGPGIEQSYIDNRDRVRAEQEQYASDHTVAAPVTEIGGALLTPVGEIGTGLKFAAKGAGYAGRALGLSPKVEKAFQVVSEYMKASPVASAAAAGAGQGALNAAGNTDSMSDVPGSALAGGVIGGGVGGAVGGALKLGTAGVRAIRNAGEGAAPGQAYGKIAQLLDNAKMTPQDAVDQIAAARAGGSDARVMDLTPGLRANAAHLSRQPNVPSSNALVDTGDARIAQRPQALEDKLRSLVQSPQNTQGNLPGETLPALIGASKVGDDALAAKAQITGARKSAGAADYEAALGQNMLNKADSPGMTTPDTENMISSPGLKEFVSGAGPSVRGAFAKAAKLIQDERLDPRDYGFALRDGLKADGTGGVVSPDDLKLVSVPSMRAFDYIKRGIDSQISDAVKAGDNNTARILSNEVQALKAHLTAANPEYGDALARQADFYQQGKAVETGQGLLSRLTSRKPDDGPRQVMADIQKLTTKPDGSVDTVKADQVRTGMLDALLQSDNYKADTVKYVKSLMQSPDQQEVFKFLVGNDPAKLQELQRFISTESKATLADTLTAHGRQSATSTYVHGDDSPTGGVLKSALRGLAFGGKLGAVSGVVRGIENLGTSNSAKDKIAQILLGTGGDIPAGVAQVQGKITAQKAADMKRALMVTRALQQPYTSALGK